MEPAPAFPAESSSTVGASYFFAFAPLFSFPVGTNRMAPTVSITHSAITHQWRRKARTYEICSIG